MSSGIKRSLFSKPAWAAAAPAASTKSTTDESQSVFGRNTVYEDILVAEQKKREKKYDKARERAEKAKDEGGDAKRRRVSLEAEGVNLLSDSDIQSISSQASEERRSPIIEDRPVTRSTPKKDKILQIGLDDATRPSPSPRRNLATTQTPVNLDSDDQAEDDELVVLTPPKAKHASSSKPKPKPKPQLDEYESEEEDEFLQELKRKAREKARLQKAGLVDGDRASAPATTAAKSASIASAPARPSSVEQTRPASSSNSNADVHSETPTSQQQDKEREKPDDPDVKILITSTIPDTKPLIVKRKASQPLKQVREFWCQRNNLDPKTTTQIFFTWRGTRLFDSTTMRGPIQKLKSDQAAKQRRIVLLDDDDDDNDDDDTDADQTVEDPSQGRITLEATTQELFDERQREKERKAHASGDHDGHGDDDDDDDAYYREQEAAREQAEREAEEKLKGSIVIRLVSQIVEPMNLRVRPHTSIGKMMQGFAATRKLDEGKTAWLVFDGERLDPGSTVKDAGLEDEDEVEVHIR